MATLWRMSPITQLCRQSLLHTHTHARTPRELKENTIETLCLLDCIALLKLVCPASHCSISIALDWAYSCCGDGVGAKGRRWEGKGWRGENKKGKTTSSARGREPGSVHSWTQCSQMCADVVSLLTDDTGHGSPRDRTHSGLSHYRNSWNVTQLSLL